MPNILAYTVTGTLVDTPKLESLSFFLKRGQNMEHILPLRATLDVISHQIDKILG